MAPVALLFALCDPARAAELAISVFDQDGNPAANAVVTLVPADARAAADATSLGTEKLVDQRDETFVPHVTILPVGGEVRFGNSDAPLHQVYSFSPIKQFELTLAPGETSEGVVFDQAGVAAIGCNIHDHMIAYIFVTETPWTVLTGENGAAEIADLPAGSYIAEIWHPRLPPATDTPRAELLVLEAGENFATNITLLPDRRARRNHSGHY